MPAGLHCSPGSSPSWVWPAAEHFFVRPLVIPAEVLQAKLADGRSVHAAVDLSGVINTSAGDAGSFCDVWRNRRDLDLPIWLEHGTIDRLTATAWHTHISDLLEFIARAGGRSITCYTFPSEASVLYVAALGDAFAVDLPSPRAA